MGAEDFVKLSVRARIDFASTGTSEKAELAFYRGIQHCGLTNTCGVILASDLPLLGPRRVADELVAKGYWEVIPNGWAYIAWDKWNGDLEQVQEKRARDAARKREKRRAERQASIQGDAA